MGVRCVAPLRPTDPQAIAAGGGHPARRGYGGALRCAPATDGAASDFGAVGAHGRAPLHPLSARCYPRETNDALPPVRLPRPRPRPRRLHLLFLLLLRQPPRL